MGKLAIISDLHVDINQLGAVELALLSALLRSEKVTHVHLAGDTANDIARVQEVVARLSQPDLSVTYNFGNHELPSVASPAAMEDYPDPQFLNQRALRLNENLVLVGVNGWYDYSFSQEADPLKNATAKNRYWYDRLIEREATDGEIMAQILTRLKSLLDDLAVTGKHVILATHFVPRREFIIHHHGRFARWNQVNAFLGSDAMGALLDTYENIAHVVFGHTHRSFEPRQFAGTTYQARPFGYFYEWRLTREFVLSRGLLAEFNPLKVRGVLKDHQAAFQVFRAEHLESEFKRSLSLFEY